MTLKPVIMEGTMESPMAATMKSLMTMAFDMVALRVVSLVVGLGMHSAVCLEGWMVPM